MLDKKKHSTVMLKLKFIRSMTALDVTNNTLDMVIFNPKEMLGILDLRLMGYFRVKHSRYERKEGKGMVQKSLQAKSSGITLPKVHTVNKGIDTNVQSEKQIIKPTITSEEKAAVPQNKPRLDLGMSLPLDKLIPQQLQSIAQPKIVSDVSLPERSRAQDKFISVSWVRFGEDFKSRIINRKSIQNISKEIPPYTDSYYRPPPRPPGIPLQTFLRTLTDLDADINMDCANKRDYN